MTVKNQFELFDKMQKQGKIVIEQLGVRSGVYFYDKATNDELTYDEMTFEDKGNKYAIMLLSGRFVDSCTIESVDSKIVVELLLVK